MRIAIVPTLLVSVMVISVGCLSPRADPTAFYVLTPMEGPAASSARGGDVSLGVGPVTIPAYLNRAQMVTRVGTNQLDVSDHDRWAESLDQGLARTLARNLSILLGGADVTIHPWYADKKPERQVSIDVSRFERDATGAAVLECTWAIVSSSTGERLAGNEVRVAEPAAAESGAAGSVAAMSRALEGLSQEIAAAMR